MAGFNRRELGAVQRQHPRPLAVPSPLHFLILVVAGWLNREQRAVIDYLLAENQVLRSRLPNKRVLPTDAERRKLARKAKAVGRKGLERESP